MAPNDDDDDDGGGDDDNDNDNDDDDAATAAAAEERLNGDGRLRKKGEGVEGEEGREAQSWILFEVQANFAETHAPARNACVGVAAMDVKIRLRQDHEVKARARLVCSFSLPPALPSPAPKLHDLPPSILLARTDECHTISLVTAT
jgi:hypothetical protein